MGIKKYIIPVAAVAALGLGSKQVYTTIATKERAAPYLQAIADATAKYKIPDGLLYKLLERESAFRPDVINGTTRSPTGAVGIAQFLPSTAAWLLKTDQNSAVQYVLDPFKAIPLAAKYLAMQRNDKRINSWEEAVAAYNQGAGTVNKSKRAASNNGGSWLDYLPKEGVNYVAYIKQGMGGAIA